MWRLRLGLSARTHHYLTLANVTPAAGRLRIDAGRLRIDAASKLGEDKPPLPFSVMPGPKALPLIGNSLELKKNFERLRLYYQEGFEKYGKIYRVKGMGQYNVLVKDPSTIEKVLRAEGKYPMRETTFTPNFVWLYENRVKKPPTLPFQDGKRWKEVRSAIGKQIIPRNVQIFHDSYNATIRRFKKYIRSSRMEDGTMRDIDFPFRRLFIELASLTVYGSEMDAVVNPTPEDEEFIAAVARIFELEVELIVSLPLYKLYDNKLSRDFRAAFKVLEKRTEAEKDRIYAQVGAGEESTKPGLLEQWLREGKLTEETAMNEAKDIFSAGVDTTANQAIFLVHAIAANKDVQEKLYREIKTVLGDHELPLPEHLSKMPFMKGCLLESYRLYGTVPGTVRVLQEDSVLHGYLVPASTTVTYALYTAGRDSSLFPDPLTFDPDRWKRDDTHAFAIQPFGFGPRACYGRRFAELELKILLIQIVNSFKLSTDIKDLDTVERQIVSPKGDVTVRFLDRKN